VQADLVPSPDLRNARLCLWASWALLLGAAMLVVRAAWPAAADDADALASAPASARQLPPMPGGRPDLQPLIVKLAGRTLIRPAQVQAAVKTDGTAERLLKLLKLQGIVRIGDTSVAYIQVEKEGVKTVREGETVLDFVVERIEPNKVVLNLQGVVVTLGAR
jgi:hypothetical protein